MVLVETVILRDHDGMDDMFRQAIDRQPSWFLWTYFNLHLTGIAMPPSYLYWSVYKLMDRRDKKSRCYLAELSTRRLLENLSSAFSPGRKDLPNWL